MKRQLISFLSTLLLLTPVVSLHCEKVSFEFVDQKYGDILYALSTYREIAIIADDTVSGNASFQFVGTDFEKAFDSFLAMNKLYVSKNDTVWTVSRIAIQKESIDGNITVDALEVTPAQIFDRLSRFTGTTILFDLLPSSKISIHVSKGNAQTIAQLVMKPFTSYIVDTSENSIFIKRSAEPVSTPLSLSRMTVEHTGETYSAVITQAKISEILERLCAEEKIQYSSFIRNDPLISGIRIEGKNFNEVLAIILEQAGCEVIEKNGVRYFLPSAIPDLTKKIRDDSFIWKEFTTHSIRLKEATNLLTARHPDVKVIPLEGTDSFLAQVSEKKSEEISSYLAMIDRKKTNDIVHLQYISTTDFLKVIPPSVKKEELTDTGTGNSFFFSGSPEMKNIFLTELKEIDKPKERIRYDMLIIQYENSSNLSWGANAEIRQLAPGDMTSITGSFGSLLSLNFDVITLFGYQFSARLNTALAENSAHIFADTTLHGITGENIKFQNTSTYRYRDSNVDPETGKPVYTGITREIVSGVVLEINGWVSGDGMVTMNIHASVSKRGADVSLKSGNPPPTSEKNITTKVSTANGEPVILSGLTQNDSSIVEQRIPFISRIPLVGWLFRNRVTTKEQTEMIIYLVPHITNGNNSGEKIRELSKTAYERLVKPFISEELK